MTFVKFRERWNLDMSDISSEAYVYIKMAIRKCDCSEVEYRDISKNDREACLLFIKLPTSALKTLLTEGDVYNRLT